MSAQAGKGDSPRPVDAKTYGENYDSIFRKKVSKDQPCPKCGGIIEWDAGDMGSYWEPPTPAWIGCVDCEYEPQEHEIDFESFYATINQ